MLGADCFAGAENNFVAMGNADLPAEVVEASLSA